MNANEIKQATDKLVQATTQAATQAGETAEARAAALAPELAAGSSTPGGYMYQRHIAPVVPALTAELVTQGRQQAVRGAIRDATHASAVELEMAQRAQRERQRAFEAERDRRYKENQRRQRARAAAQAAAYNNLLAGGGGGVGSGIVINSKTAPAVGNNSRNTTQLIQPTHNPQRTTNPQRTSTAPIQGGSATGLRGGNVVGNLGTQLLRGVKF